MKESWHIDNLCYYDTPLHFTNSVISSYDERHQAKTVCYLYKPVNMFFFNKQPGNDITVFIKKKIEILRKSI